MKSGDVLVMADGIICVRLPVDGTEQDVGLFEIAAATMATAVRQNIKRRKTELEFFDEIAKTVKEASFYDAIVPQGPAAGGGE